MLQEKIIKTQRSLKSFKNLLSDVKVKNTSATQELAQHWSEIESFMKNSKVVFEFEGYYKNNSGPIDFITRVGNRIKKVFETEKVILSTGYHQKKKQDYPDHWFVEKDGSLSSDHDSYQPFEIVCPYTPIKDAHDVLDKFKKGVYNWYYGITDNTTGGHINITCPHDKLDFIKLVILGNDHLWLKTFNREFNEYCQSQYKYIKKQIENLPDGLTFDEIISSISVKFEKYTAFNFIKTDPPTIEFRVPGDDYLRSKLDAYKDSLDWFIFMIAVGMNKQMFRQEYVTKVLRLYRNSRKESDPKFLKNKNSVTSTSWISDLIRLSISAVSNPYKLLKALYPKILRYPDVEITIPERLRVWSFNDNYYDPEEDEYALMNAMSNNEYKRRYYEVIKSETIHNSIKCDEFIDSLAYNNIPNSVIKSMILAIINDSYYESEYPDVFNELKTVFESFGRICLDLKLNIMFPRNNN